MAAAHISEQPTKPETAINKLGLGARAYSRVLKVGRTIADLAGTEEIQPRPHRRGDSI